MKRLIRLNGVFCKPIRCGVVWCTLDVANSFGVEQTPLRHQLYNIVGNQLLRSAKSANCKPMAVETLWVVHVSLLDTWSRISKVFDVLV